MNTSDVDGRILEQLEELRGEVRTLKAEKDIRSLLARVAHGADDGDIDDYLRLFTPDAVWHYKDGESWEGTEAQRRRVIEFREIGFQGPGANSRHISTTITVDILDEDHAESQSYYLYIRDARESPVIAVTGRYRDSLRRTADGWCIARRTVIVDVN